MNYPNPPKYSDQVAPEYISVPGYRCQNLELVNINHHDCAICGKLRIDFTMVDRMSRRPQDWYIYCADCRQTPQFTEMQEAAETEDRTSRLNSRRMPEMNVIFHSLSDPPPTSIWAHLDFIRMHEHMEISSGYRQKRQQEFLDAHSKLIIKTQHGISDHTFRFHVKPKSFWDGIRLFFNLRKLKKLKFKITTW